MLVTHLFIQKRLVLTQIGEFRMSSSTQNAFSKHSAELKGKGEDALNLVQENAAEYYDQGIKQMKKFEKGITSRIQKNPIQSLLIVAGVGLVFGTLWNRR
jgi:ElaB/YqjD/DUF883 family membrane-anchored ribosome-binding protein